MDTFFKDITIENTLYPNTAGYDIHYTIIPGEESVAAEVKEKVIAFIDEYKRKNEHAPIYITKHQLTDKPVGPWKTNMWEIQIFTVSSDASPLDHRAIEDNKTKELHAFIRTVADFAKNAIMESKLQGSLLIHGNTWPKNSDMKGERNAHFNTAWIVCGPKPDLKDVWKELVDMEFFIRKLIRGAGDDWKSQKTEINRLFTESFRNNPVYQGEKLQNIFENLFTGYDNLCQMQENIKKLTIQPH